MINLHGSIILYNRSKHTELLLVTANEQFIKQIALNLDLKPGSDLYFFKIILFKNADRS